MGVGVPRLPERVAVDDCRVDVSDEPGDGGTAVVRDGGLRDRLDSDRACVSLLPEDHLARHRIAEHEVSAPPQRDVMEWKVVSAIL